MSVKSFFSKAKKKRLNYFLTDQMKPLLDVATIVDRDACRQNAVVVRIRGLEALLGVIWKQNIQINQIIGIQDICCKSERDTEY